MATNQSYSGSLQAKKKAELQEISQALNISDTGTREELQSRIKRYLDDHERDLEENPTFTGLFVSRRRGRSLQPQSSNRSVEEQSFDSGNNSLRHGRTSLASIQEQADHDLRDVSMMLPKAARYSGSPTPSRITGEVSTSNSLPPLPLSPEKSLIADAMSHPEIQAVVEMEQNMVRESKHIFLQSRQTLSSTSSIFILTAMLDLFVMIVTIHNASLSSNGANMPPVIQTISLAAAQWAIPSAVIPTIFGYLISFNTARDRIWSFDYLTASIVRFACNVVYPFAFVRLTETEAVRNLDVLGIRWRLTTAGVTLAFGFAEAIYRSADKALLSSSVVRQHTPSQASSVIMHGS